MRDRQCEFSTPLGTATHGRLEFARGASRVTILVDDDMPDLVRARFDGAAPMVLANDGKVVVEYPLVSPSEWLRPRRAALVTLNATIPWDLVFSGGVSRLRGDLTGLDMRSLSTRGASDVELVLPEPHGVVRVAVQGGASDVSLRHPPGAAVALSVAGGVSKLAFDGRRYGSIGGETQLQSLDAGELRDRYEIEIGGGASDLTIAPARP